MQKLIKTETDYYSNGKNKFIVKYQDNIKILHQELLENGQVTYDVQINDNVTESKMFYLNGQLRSHSQTKQMTVAGICQKKNLFMTLWFDNGQVAQEDKIGNKTKYYDKNGNLIDEDTFSKLGYVKLFDENWKDLVKYKDPIHDNLDALNRI